MSIIPIYCYNRYKVHYYTHLATFMRISFKHLIYPSQFSISSIIYLHNKNSLSSQSIYNNYTKVTPYLSSLQ